LRRQAGSNHHLEIPMLDRYGELRRLTAAGWLEQYE
jgi:hypothetical protein